VVDIELAWGGGGEVCCARLVSVASRVQRGFPASDVDQKYDILL
jgi:hypothetical protein